MNYLHTCVNNSAILFCGEVVAKLAIFIHICWIDHGRIIVLLTVVCNMLLLYSPPLMMFIILPHVQVFVGNYNETAKNYTFKTMKKQMIPTQTIESVYNRREM
jgi:hypothetical protein